MPGLFVDVYEGGYGKQRVCVKMIRLSQKDSAQWPVVSDISLYYSYLSAHPLFSIFPIAHVSLAHARELAFCIHLLLPNILPFYGAYIDQQSGRPCLISPWMEHGNLRDYLRNNPKSHRMLLVSEFEQGTPKRY